jgi:hypothetical protein
MPPDSDINSYLTPPPTFQYKNCPKSPDVYFSELKEQCGKHPSNPVLPNLKSHPKLRDEKKSKNYTGKKGSFGSGL